MLNPTSNPLTRLRDPAGATAREPAMEGEEEAAGRLTWAPVLVGGRAAGAPLARAAEGAPAVGGRGGAGAPPGTVGAEGAAETGPPAGKVGSLIVGEEVGFGGRLIRTVSFLGCTLAASAGFGGTG
jgi:hypothetical protein